MTNSEAQIDHVELTVQRMAELHAQHLEAQSPLQKRVSGITANLAQPRVLLWAGALSLAWIALNLGLGLLEIKPFDAPPFEWLQLVATFLALVTTLMILATQAREEEAARHRSHLTLQLASLTEQKIAKVIALLEEQRRDNRLLPSRSDPEAVEMAQSADPGHVLDRIKDTHEG